MTREDVREIVSEERGLICEFAFQMDCEGGLELHEGLLERSKKLKHQEYLWHKYNCFLVCQKHHALIQGRRKYRKYLFQLQCSRYGQAEIINWLEDAKLPVAKWWEV